LNLPSHVRSNTWHVACVSVLKEDLKYLTGSDNPPEPKPRSAASSRRRTPLETPPERPRSVSTAGSLPPAAVRPFSGESDPMAPSRKSGKVPAWLQEMQGGEEREWNSADKLATIPYATDPVSRPETGPDDDDEFDSDLYLSGNIGVPNALRNVRSSQFDKSLQSASTFVAPDMSLSMAGFHSSGDVSSALKGAPAGARGLRTPKSMQKASAMAANLEEDSSMPAASDTPPRSAGRKTNRDSDRFVVGTPPSTAGGWSEPSGDRVGTADSGVSRVMRGMPSPSVFEAKNNKRLSMLKALDTGMGDGGDDGFGGTDLSAIQNYLDSRDMR